MHIDIPLTIYLLTSVVACYGLSIFIYWWSTIGKATTIFMYVTALFFSILFENVAFFFLRLLFYNDLDTHSYIVLLKGQYIGIFGIPLLVVLFLIVFTMTKRIIRTNKAIMAIKDYEKPKECANKVLVITNSEELNNKLKGIFICNEIAYYCKSDFLESLELLVAFPDISVVLFDLECSSGNETTCEQLVKVVKKERPWTIMVAMTQKPTIRELCRVRRAYFDDYFKIPIDPEILLRSFKRWVARVNRWRQIKEGN